MVVIRDTAAGITHLVASCTRDVSTIVSRSLHHCPVRGPASAGPGAVTMPLEPGTTLGPSERQAPPGAGRMAEAREIRLDRVTQALNHAA